MSRQYSLAIETLAPGSHGVDRTGAVAALSEFPFAQGVRAAETLCRAIGIADALHRIEAGGPAVIEVPLARISRMLAHYGDDFIAIDRDVTVNGHCVDRVASRQTIARLDEARRTAASSSARKAYLRAH